MSAPRGAKEIEALRDAGSARLELPVVVCLGVEPPAMENLVLRARGNEGDWRCVRGLDVHVWVRKGEHVGGLLVEIRRAMPLGLSLWDVDKRRGAHVTADGSGGWEMRLMHEPMTAEVEAITRRMHAADVAREGQRDLRLVPWGRDLDVEYAEAVR